MQAKCDERQVSADSNRVCDLVFKGQPSPHLSTGSHLDQSLEPCSQQQACGRGPARSHRLRARRSEAAPLGPGEIQFARLTIRDIDLVVR